jgi:hypothetical protein
MDNFMIISNNTMKHEDGHYHSWHYIETWMWSWSFIILSWIMDMVIVIQLNTEIYNGEMVIGNVFFGNWIQGHGRWHNMSRSIHVVTVLAILSWTTSLNLISHNTIRKHCCVLIFSHKGVTVPTQGYSYGYSWQISLSRKICCHYTSSNTSTVHIVIQAFNPIYL